MGARWYDSALGRWLSADTVVPEPGNPQSLNRYSWVLGNSLKYRDPTGHCVDGVSTAFCLAVGGAALVGGLVVAAAVIIDIVNVAPITTERVPPPPPPEATSWLIEQIKTNSQSEGTRLMQESLASWNPIDKVGATKAWVALVRTNAIWDFKNDVKPASISGSRDLLLGGYRLNYQAIANIHFGFVGRAAGFGSELLKAGAGAFQIKQWLFTDSSKVGTASTYFDQPFDAWSVQFGIYLYDLYGQDLDKLTPEALEKALQEYIERYGSPPEATAE
jgi:hypothetical protein